MWWEVEFRKAIHSFQRISGWSSDPISFASVYLMSEWKDGEWKVLDIQLRLIFENIQKWSRMKSVGLWFRLGKGCQQDQLDSDGIRGCFDGWWLTCRAKYNVSSQNTRSGCQFFFAKLEKNQQNLGGEAMEQEKDSPTQCDQGSNETLLNLHTLSPRRIDERACGAGRVRSLLDAK